MKRHSVLLTGLVLSGVMVLGGCAGSNPVSQPAPLPPEVARGMLGDLNQYIHQLLSQRGAGNGQAENVLVRLLGGKGLPASESVASGRGK
ncbi:hypothetical protein ACUJ63_004303 [Salmonella enterica subsp. enterica]